MNTYVALLRGVNVGGKTSLPMKGLVALLENMGLTDVSAYIQSGNVVFRSDEKELPGLAKRISSEIKKHYSFEPFVLMLRPEVLDRAIEKNPFPEAVADPGKLHICFLDSAPGSPDLERLTNLKKESERFHLCGDIFYLHTPEGMGRSRLAASAERLLGVTMTARNWKTVCKIKELAGK